MCLDANNQFAWLFASFCLPLYFAYFLALVVLLDKFYADYIYIL